MIESNGVRNWASQLDPNALLQAERTARCPVVSGPVALMPDAHVGMGATIGSVVATEGAIIPAAVGVDIGCGMIAAETELTASDLPDSLNALHSLISYAIPAGVGRGNDDLSDRRAERWLNAHPLSSLTEKLPAKALTQLGSLGSGNHFLELCLDEHNHVWLVLHSGSRGVGNILGSGHIKVARRQELGIEDRDLAYFLESQPEFHAYIQDMLWCQDYALFSRSLMFSRAMVSLATAVGRKVVAATDVINCHHNFAAQETHSIDGELIPVWVTRKGAIRAEIGDRGVIPGSMGACSYIVEGKGISESYNSCAHGAGRRMSRGQAKRELSKDDLRIRMEGIAWNQNASALLDEHPLAYKDIEQVMEDQADLVTVTHVLRQVLNYKGS